MGTQSCCSKNKLNKKRDRFLASENLEVQFASQCISCCQSEFLIKHSILYIFQYINIIMSNNKWCFNKCIFCCCAASHIWHSAENQHTWEDLGEQLSSWIYHAVSAVHQRLGRFHETLPELDASAAAPTVSHPHTSAALTHRRSSLTSCFEQFATFTDPSHEWTTQITKNRHSWSWSKV